MNVEQAQQLINTIRCYGRVTNTGKREISTVLLGTDMISVGMRRIGGGQSIMYGINADGIVRLFNMGATMKAQKGHDGKDILVFDWTDEYKD